MVLANFLNAAALLATIAVPLADLAKKTTKEGLVNIQIGVGSGGDATGGNVPHVALWDEKGSRIGQHHPKSKERIEAGQTASFSIASYQTKPKDSTAQPEYIMLSMNDNDAICVTFIYVSDNRAQWAWYGDLGWKCGADWYPSNQKVGSGTYTPKCVWIDKNHSKGIRSQGLSLHMPDFSSTEAMFQQYIDNPDTLCKSTPRMKMWGEIWPDSSIPTFQPPLKYTATGADEDPHRVIDKTKRQDPKAFRQPKRENSNNRPGHLVLSNIEGHSAKELCESETSLGADFVSTAEGVYCDMTAKQQWPLCSDSITTSCFDLNRKTMRGGNRVLQTRDKATGRIVPDKSYKTVDHWK
ncbi:hypothetical protein MMC16_007055 [Acarospora aff. strigata]|nr:hypothetical protein [Acarospora aff. strigata]